MYYRIEKAKHSEGFNDQTTGPSAELVAVFRAYHADNRIVKNSRKLIDDFNAEDLVIYKDKATMDAYDAECKALTSEGKTWGSGIMWESKEQGECLNESHESFSSFDLSAKSTDF